MTQAQLAQFLASLGQRGDNMLAYVNDGEMDLLKRLGGSGKRNPITGAKSFWSDGGTDTDGESEGGGRRGGDSGFSDTSSGTTRDGGGGGGGSGFGGAADADYDFYSSVPSLYGVSDSELSSFLDSISSTYPSGGKDISAYDSLQNGYNWMDSALSRGMIGDEGGLFGKAVRNFGLTGGYSGNVLADVANLIGGGLLSLGGAALGPLGSVAATGAKAGIHGIGDKMTNNMLNGPSGGVYASVGKDSAKTMADALGGNNNEEKQAQAYAEEAARKKKKKTMYALYNPDSWIQDVLSGGSDATA